MKALPMLDHVALSLARAFCVVLILFSYILLPTALIAPLGTVATGLASILEVLIAAFFWLVCSFHLHRRLSRVCFGIVFGIIAGCNFLEVTQELIVKLMHLPKDDFLPSLAKNLIFPGIWAFGFGAIFWSSIRPPKPFPAPI